MQEQLEKRLAELSQDFETGKKKLEGLEAEAAELHHTLLRISGAIQVLQEELHKATSDATPQGEAQEQVPSKGSENGRSPESQSLRRGGALV